MLHLVGVFFLLVATVLLIVVSVGTPVWDSVYFLKADINPGILKLGQWGYCLDSVCTKAHLGYKLTLIASGSNDVSAEVASGVVHGLTFALILRPIAAGISFIALLFAVCNHLLTGIVGSLCSCLAFVVTIVAWGIDLGLFLTARHRLNNLYGGNSAHLSNAIWLVLIAWLCQLFAACTVCFVSRSHRRRRALETRNDTAAAPAGMVEVPRRHWWQRRTYV